MQASGRQLCSGSVGVRQCKARQDKSAKCGEFVNIDVVYLGTVIADLQAS